MNLRELESLFSITFAMCFQREFTISFQICKQTNKQLNCVSVKKPSLGKSRDPYTTLEISWFFIVNLRNMEGEFNLGYLQVR